MRENETVTVVVSTGAPKVEVPDVTEKSEENARKNLEDKGFKVTVVATESSTAEPGTVLDQDPKGGTKAEPESEVKITVARQATQNVPDVRTKQYDAAVAQLNGVGFKNVSRSDVDSDKPAGEVIDQTPAPDGKKPLDTQIVLKVSKGPTQPATKPIPEVRFKTVGEAKQLLAAQGFTQIQFTPGSATDDNARVISIDPAPGTQADPANTVITLTTMGGNGNGNGNIFGGPSGSQD
jgi:serine/threonine-protein kinase